MGARHGREKKRKNKGAGNQLRLTGEGDGLTENFWWMIGDWCRPAEAGIKSEIEGERGK